MDKKIQNNTSADAIDSEKKSSEKKPASFSSDTPFFWQKPKYQAVIIILFSLAIGHAWHIRGSGPWGGMTGMWAVGIFTVLLIFLIFGNRKRATPTWIGILVVLFALTVGGWGTLNKQTTGRLVDTGFYDITVSPWSGAFYIFLIGFGWGPLFGFSLGIFMGKREYSFKEFMGGILMFFAGVYLSKVLVAHVIIPVTAEDAYNLFAHAVSEQSGQTPWQFYLDHFFSTSDLKALAGGRNYEAMVSNFSDSFGAIILWLYVKYLVKDPHGSKYTIVIPLLLGASILIANFWIFWDKGCLFQADAPYDLSGPVGLTGEYTCTPPDWLDGIGWGMWEYSTGFLFGLGLAIFLLRQKKSNTEEALNAEETVIPKSIKNFITFATYYGVVIFAAVWFPIGSIIGRWGERLGWSEKWDNLYLYIIIGAALIYTAVIYYWKRKVEKGERKYPRRPVRTHVFYLMVAYWVGFFIMDRFITPHSAPLSAMDDILDALSITLGVPLLCYLYFRVIKPKIKSK